MRYSIVVAFEKKMVWKDLSPNTSHKLVLFNIPRDIPGLKQRGEDIYFEKIYEVENLETETLIPPMEDFFANIYQHKETNHTNIRIATFHEGAILSCAELRKKYHIPGDKLEDVLPYRNKIVMKQYIPKTFLPKYLKFDPIEYSADANKYYLKIEDTTGYPMIAKPTQDMGSAGVTKLMNRQELMVWAGNHQNRFDMELDEFLDGDLYHVDTLHKNSKVLDIRVSRYLTPLADFLLKQLPGASIVVPEDQEDFQLLTNFSNRIMKYFPTIPDGAKHLEVFKLRKNNELRFLEIAARPPGAGTPDVYKKYCGLHYNTLHYQLQLDLPYSIETTVGPYAAWAFIPPRPGRIAELVNPNFESNYEITWNYQVGESVNSVNALSPGIARLLIFSFNYSLLSQDFYQRLATHVFQINFGENGQGQESLKTIIPTVSNPFFEKYWPFLTTIGAVFSTGIILYLIYNLCRLAHQGNLTATARLICERLSFFNISSRNTPTPITLKSDEDSAHRLKNN